MKNTEINFINQMIKIFYQDIANSLDIMDLDSFMKNK